MGGEALTFASQYGWAIDLPPGWKRLPGTGESLVLATTVPVVFAFGDSLALRLTWMATAAPVDLDLFDCFQMATMAEGAASVDLSIAVATGTFPLIGTLVQSTCLRLADGARALEIIEQFEQNETRRNGYQLIFPIQPAGRTYSRFQRLCFYAGAEFSLALPAVRTVCRSFRYERPFVLPAPPDILPPARL